MIKEISMPNTEWPCRVLSSFQKLRRSDLSIENRNANILFCFSAPTPAQRVWVLKNKITAFTLIELILVMALLSIVLAVSAPALSGFFNGRTIDSEARRLVSLTRYGQSRAVSEGVPTILWIDARKNTYGLRTQTGYTDNDTNTVQFTLDK